MDLRQIVETMGTSQFALSREANISRWRLMQFFNGELDLSPQEERAVVEVLKRRGQQVDAAMKVLMDYASIGGHA